LKEKGLSQTSLLAVTEAVFRAMQHIFTEKHKAGLKNIFNQ